MKPLLLLFKWVAGVGILTGLSGCDSPPWDRDEESPASPMGPMNRGYYYDTGYEGCHFTELASVTLSSSYSRSYTLIAAGDRAYAVLDDEIAIFDITVKEAVSLVSGIDGTSFHDSLDFLEVSGTHLYAGDGYALYTFDYSNRGADPVPAGTVETGHGYSNIALSGGRIVLSAASWAQDDISLPLLLFSLANGVPGAPLSIPVPDGHIESIAIFGNYLFAEFINAGYAATPCLKVVDLTTPEAPRFGECTALPGTVSDLQINGNKLFVALDENDAGEALRVYDVTAPTSPALTLTYSAPYTADSVASDGTWVYLVLDYRAAVVEMSQPYWNEGFDYHTMGMHYYVALNREIDDGAVYLRDYEKLLVISRCHPDAMGK